MCPFHPLCLCYQLDVSILPTSLLPTIYVSITHCLCYQLLYVPITHFKCICYQLDVSLLPTLDVSLLVTRCVPVTSVTHSNTANLGMQSYLQQTIQVLLDLLCCWGWLYAFWISKMEMVKRAKRRIWLLWDEEMVPLLLLLLLLGRGGGIALCLSTSHSPTLYWHTISCFYIFSDQTLSDVQLPPPDVALRTTFLAERKTIGMVYRAGHRTQ